MVDDVLGLFGKILEETKRLGAGPCLEEALGSVKGSEVGIVLLVADAERFHETLGKDLARRIATREVEVVGEDGKVRGPIIDAGPV
jgi:hypothetical protein